MNKLNSFKKNLLKSGHFFTPLFFMPSRQKTYPTVL